MKKSVKLLSILLVFSLVLGVLCAVPFSSAAAEDDEICYHTSGDFEYYIKDYEYIDENNNTQTISAAIISDYFGTATNLYIPEWLDYYPVFGMDIFSNDTVQYLNLSRFILDIPFGVTENFSKLESISVDSENPVLAAEKGVLYDYDKLYLISYPCARPESTLVPPDSVTYIYCINSPTLKTLRLSYGVDFIEPFAFMDCPNLTNIYVVPQNEVFYSKDGVLFKHYSNTDDDANEEITTTELVCYPAGKTQTSYEIPEGTQEIGAFSFANAVNLEKVTLPDSLWNIYMYAFESCTNLAEFGNSEYVSSVNISSVCDTAWYSNHSDGDVYFGKSLLGYKGEMPQNYTLNVKPGTENIGSYSFLKEKNLTSVNIPEGVKYIGIYSFGSTSLTEVRIPYSVETLDYYSFGYTIENPFEENENIIANNNFVLRGYVGTEAERYADENGLKFEALPKNILGDVDGDGEVTIDDASQIQKHLAKISTLTAIQLEAADVDGDGQVSIDDTTSIQKYIAKITDVLG